jgi:hypothetical protein
MGAPQMAVPQRTVAARPGVFSIVYVIGGTSFRSWPTLRRLLDTRRANIQMTHGPA